MGGGVRTAFTSAAYGALGGAAFGAVGFSSSGWHLATKVLAHGVTGGVLSTLEGGKFGHGFLAAGLSKAANVNSMFSAENLGAVRITIAAIVGGTVSALTGGQFANGALSAAMGQALNGESEIRRRSALDEELARPDGATRTRTVVRTFEEDVVTRPSPVGDLPTPALPDVGQSFLKRLFKSLYLEGIRAMVDIEHVEHQVYQAEVEVTERWNATRRYATRIDERGRTYIGVEPGRWQPVGSQIVREIPGSRHTSIAWDRSAQ
jgi:hypothetical protein